MPEMTIRLRRDPETGKQNIIVKLRSDEDALPHEHEQMHRALVDKLINGGILKAGEEGNLIIEREEESATAQPTSNTPQSQRQAQQQGGS
ncbi:MAG TPA: hypothetical protein VN688_19700 [Gemmataceae bacterium]|nr:hypothetical protein [Gemmataceae bacterium]